MWQTGGRDRTVFWLRVSQPCRLRCKSANKQLVVNYKEVTTFFIENWQVLKCHMNVHCPPTYATLKCDLSIVVEMQKSI